MKIIHTTISGLILFEPQIFSDRRGYFMETYQEQKYCEAGINKPFVQDNQSYSVKDVLRGLHYQLNHPQGKLVRVTQGVVFDVAVDLRFNSPTFSKWHGEILSAENKRQMYIPEHFAHGFCVLSDYAEFLYKCTNIYVSGDEAGIIWNDPDLGIEWAIDTPILSDKDAKLPKFKEIVNQLSE